MHPPLHRPHPDCGDVVAALLKCHEDHPMAKFWGKCNEEKAALDWCFKLEKEKRRAVNARAARERRETFEQARARAADAASEASPPRAA